MAIQTIRRVPTMPQIPPDASKEFSTFVYGSYIWLTQQVNAMLTGLAQYQSGSPNMPAITAGAASVKLTFTTPFTDLFYSAAPSPDWNTTVWWSAKQKTSITFNFGTVAPGANNLLVICMR